MWSYKFCLHFQGFLLSSAQQTVDKLISQTQDAVKSFKKNDLNNPLNDASNVDVISQAENLIQDSEKAKQVRWRDHSWCRISL